MSEQNIPEFKCTVTISKDCRELLEDQCIYTNSLPKTHIKNIILIALFGLNQIGIELADQVKVESIIEVNK